MGKRRSFPFLLSLFQDRFFESDEVSPVGGFQTNIYQVLGILATASFVATYFLTPFFVELSRKSSTPENDWALRTLRLFFPAYSFSIAGFAALFYWDTLFPDRRDFLILASFPIRLRDLFAAKLAALGRFLLLLIAAINVVPDAMALLVGMLTTQSRAAGLRLALAQIAATTGASAFGFLAVVAFQGLLIGLTSPRMFRRLSPWVQMIGMSLTVAAILEFPIYSIFFRPAVEGHSQWLYFFPPAWFSGLYELFLGGSNHYLSTLGIYAAGMMGVTALFLCIAWALGFRRHFRRTLEAEDARHLRPPLPAPGWFVRSPQERAIFGFIGTTLARSRKHQYFLSTYVSIGLCFALFLGIAVRAGKLAFSPEGTRSFAFIVGFFVVSGFRALFQFPAELGSNWIFRITESRWAEMSRAATRKVVLLRGLIPALLLTACWDTAAWDGRVALQHSAIQLAAGALLIEALFWKFDKIPFTCSYFPGTTNLAILGALYLYGFTAYSFQMAGLESAIERHGLAAALFYLAAGALLTLSWRRRPPAAAVRFDGGEPAIQTLDLT